MKKQASTPFLMWLMVISLQTHIIIAAVLSKFNDTTTSVVCDASVEDCQNIDHLDSQLPTISSSHFRRILAAAGGITPAALVPNKAAIKCQIIEKYGSCLPPRDPKGGPCGIYNRSPVC